MSFLSNRIFFLIVFICLNSLFNHEQALDLFNNKEYDSYMTFQILLVSTKRLYNYYDRTINNLHNIICNH